MILKPKSYAFLIGAFLGAAGLANAASSFVTFSVDMATNIANATFIPGTDTVYVQGTFNNWSSFIQLSQDGSGSVYTNTFNDTLEPNGGVTKYQFVRRIGTGGSDTYETSADFNLRAVRLPSAVGGSVAPPTPFFGDLGPIITNSYTFQVDLSQQIALGYFTNDTGSGVEVRGNFNGWTGGATVLARNSSILRTNQYGLVTSNVYVGTIVDVAYSTNAAMDFKYVIQPGTIWESPSSLNGDNGGNRFFTHSQIVPQVLPVVDFSDAPYAPLCGNTFSVDMSGPAGFDTSYDASSVRVAGSFNGWASDIPMTNNPAAANTNIFTTSISIGAGTGVNYQFRYNNSGGTVYDHLNGATGGQGNRVFTVPALASYAIPTVFFNDAGYNDYLSASLAVTFTVNMNGAVGTDNTPWVEGTGVFVNGPWPNWQGWDPISLSSQRLYEIGTSGIFTNTFMIPAAIVTSLTYKYSIAGADNEAQSDNNHNRVIRSTITGAYGFSQDKFGSQYVEPSFGQVAVGAMSAGTVPLSWLGRPGCKVQTTSSLSSGAWVSLPLTDGTNWNVGTVSTNGLVSATNWPAASGNLFFRLIKQ